MSGFLKKKIENIQTLGEKLSQHRQALGYSQEKAARAINLNARYIKQLESDSYNSLPADVYTINILKKYANLLNLNPSTVVNEFEKEKRLFLKMRKQKTENKITGFKKLVNFFLNPKFLKYLAIAGLSLAIIFYLGISINRIVSPPRLTLESPADELKTKEYQIAVKGQSEKEVTLTINNRPLLSDKNGGFELTIDLQKGLNLIKVTAQKKHSKEQTIYRRVVVVDEEEPIKE